MTLSPFQTTQSLFARHRHAWLAIAFFAVFLLSCGPGRVITDILTETIGDREPAEVIKIVDGDTIEVILRGNNETVRYVGVDTPERSQPGYNAAKEANRALVAGKRVYLEQDKSHRDSFGRLLRFVFLEDGTLVNAKLIADGLAQPLEISPDTERAAEFRQLALEAAQAKRGFWSGTSDVDGAMSYALTTQEAEVRRGPGAQYDLNTRLPANTVLVIFGRSPNSRWLQVRPPDRDDGGWISHSSVEVNVPVATIPLGEVDGVKLAGGTPVPSRTPTATTPTGTSPTGTNPTGTNSTGKCPEGCLVQPEPVCNIKGNVNAQGEKIYHLPSNSLYRRTQINTEEGDRWFCTTKEAEGAGFRAALR